MSLSAVDPRELQRNPWNSNSVAPKNYAKLKTSIEELGFNSAVVVRELDDGSLQILGGQHRTEVAIELGMETIPVINLGRIDDIKAKKIGLVDNSRYGADDSLKLAEILEELNIDGDVTAFLPMQDEDLQLIMKAVSVDLDALELEDTEDSAIPDDDAPAPAKAPKTHDILKFRVTMRDAEAIRTRIEKTIKEEGLSEGDELTIAGEALSYLLLKAA